MARKKPNELDFSNTKLEVVIYGIPNIGKSTLAFSAGKVLMVDIDKGVGRVESVHRKDIIDLELNRGQKALDIIREDLSGDLSDIDTIAIDTIGGLLDIIKYSILEKGNGKSKQADGTLTQNGWGILANKFEEFREFLLSLNKHIIWIAHSSEVKDNDEDARTKIRIDIQGSTKNNIYKGATLVGFVEMQGKDRVIHFKPTDRYYAKSSHGIEGTYVLPKLKGNDINENVFLETLFKEYCQKLSNDMQKYGSDLQIYNNAMKLLVDIQEFENVDQLNEMVEKIKNIEHALTSKEELFAGLQVKAKELNAIYDKASKRFVNSTEN